MKRISSKIFLVILSVIIILTSLILFFTYRSVKEFYFTSLNTELVNLNRSLDFTFYEPLKNNNQNKLRSLVKRIGDRLQHRITVISPDGKVIADSDEQTASMDNHINRPEIVNAMKLGVGSSNRYSITTQEEMVYLARRIESNGEVIGFIRVSIYTQEIYDLLNELQSRMILIAILVLILSLILAIIFTRNITKPINQLSQATAKVALGDFNVNVKPKGNDEVAILTKNFYLMTRKLEELFDKVITQNDEFNTIITSIQEGLVVLDNEGKIVLSNNVFTEIVETENIYGKKYKKVIKNRDFKHLFKIIRESKSYNSIQTTIGDSHYLASGNFIESKDEVIILFHDISEIKNLEQIKRDFVINVSHELRTPLTAIKGFVETLFHEVEENKDAKHYLNIIKRHTNRLIDLVQDLMILGELEQKEKKMVITEFNIIKFIENTIGLFGQKLQTKKLSINFESQEESIRIQADQFRIDQLLINLIDNAIKYTDKGGINIIVKKSGDEVIIIIEDTGIGIPEDDLTRIFERFYLVSKSRTRKEGGTGLGLSIVKHIVLNHNGTINVESEFGKGTKFIVKLPLENVDYEVQKPELDQEKVKLIEQKTS